MKPEPYALTSRTEIENWQKCKRAWYYRKVYGENGIVPAYASVPLATGGAIHKGVEYMMTCWLAGKPIDVNQAVREAKAEYAKQVSDTMLSDTLTEQQNWTKREQSALVAALVRVWHKVELPRLQAEYDIEQSEKSLAFNLSESQRIRFMSKADAILLTKDGGEPIVYSLKTIKEWSARSEASYNTDLQGLTESLGIMEQRRELNQHIVDEQKRIRKLYKDGTITKEGALASLARLPKLVSEQVMGVRFCFLVKGPRWPMYGPDGEKVGKWTDSPFLVGYRRVGPGGIEYAHSDKTWKPENKSGYGKLGKGWERFSVYDGGEASKAVGGIKGWIEMLANGEIQPELPSPLETHVVTPVPRFPHREELQSALIQIRSEAEAAEIARKFVQRPLDETVSTLDREFPQTRRNCHWPTECDYLYACYRAAPDQDLLDPMSPYVARVPHHEVEARELAGDDEERDS